MKPALCLTFCGRVAALQLGALGLSLTLEAADKSTGSYKSKVIGHGFTHCERLEQMERIYYTQDLLRQVTY